MDLVNCEINRELYHRWINSTGWKELVARLKRERGHKCEKCGKVGGKLVGHHLSYDWFATKYEERTVLICCDACHKKIHNLKE